MDTYKKKYDEALERARKLYERGTITESLGYVFPELAESEDEKVRKAIIESLPKYGYLPQTSIKVEDAIAWLEKQGEQKPAWSEEDEHRVKDTIYFLEIAKKHYASTIEIDACIAWIKSIKQRIRG